MQLTLLADNVRHVSRASHLNLFSVLSGTIDFAVWAIRSSLGHKSLVSGGQFGLGSKQRNLGK